MFSLKEIEKYTNGKIINGDENVVISSYCVRPNASVNGGFFIPIDFHGVNREIYIVDAVRLGKIGFLIDRNSSRYDEIIRKTKEINSDVCIVAVDSVNDAICNLANLNRSLNIDKPIVAITGSVGKTSMSNMLSNILEREKRVLHDFDNSNMNTNVLISRDLMHLENYDMAVIEMGTSFPGKMTVLSELVRPSIGVITNIGTAHFNNFHSKENILNEKLHIGEVFTRWRFDLC